MKEIVVRALDDLHAAAGEKIAADHEDVPLRLGGAEVLLDLTGAHLSELEAFLAPYLAAGRNPEPARQPGGRRAAGDDRRKPGRRRAGGTHMPERIAAMPQPERKAFLAGLRAWARAQGREAEFRSPGGGWHYYETLVAGYEAALAAGAA